MVHRRSFLLGVLASFACTGAIALFAVATGALPSGADVKPSGLERAAARLSLRASIGRSIAGVRDPLPATDAVLTEGARLYGANCAVCHGAADAAPSALAQGLYIKAPQLAKNGVEDDPEPVIYWMIAHGIRFTAMPSFRKTLSEDDVWRITAFVAHMDRLPPHANALWRSLPSVAPRLR